jgi:hypothetical protein
MVMGRSLFDYEPLAESLSVYRPSNASVKRRVSQRRFNATMTMSGASFSDAPS